MILFCAANLFVAEILSLAEAAPKDVCVRSPSPCQLNTLIAERNYCKNFRESKIDAKYFICKAQKGAKIPTSSYIC